MCRGYMVSGSTATKMPNVTEKKLIVHRHNYVMILIHVIFCRTLNSGARGVNTPWQWSIVHDSREAKSNHDIERAPLHEIATSLAELLPREYLPSSQTDNGNCVQKECAEELISSALSSLVIDGGVDSRSRA